MITDGDIKKLKTIFATKDDLKSLVSKDDLKTRASKKDLDKYVTVIEFRSAIDNLVKLISDGFSRMDNMFASLKEHSDILEDHEHRLDKIEDKLLSSN